MAVASHPYNDCTLQYFENPLHAGDLEGCYSHSAVGEASESAVGARVQIAVGMQDERIIECRFRVFGCPHLVAAAEWLCRGLEGHTISALTEYRLDDCMQELAVPIEKTGRILLLEDAIRSLSAEFR